MTALRGTNARVRMLLENNKQINYLYYVEQVIYFEFL